MYANVAKTKVFFIIMPHGQYPEKIKPNRIMVGIDGSGHHEQWSLPYVVLPNNVAPSGLFETARKIYREEYGPTLEFKPSSPYISVYATQAGHGQELPSSKSGQSIDLHIFMLVKLRRGKLREHEEGRIHSLDFQDLDNGPVRKHQLPALQLKVLRGYQGKGQLPGFDREVNLDCATIGTRLAAFLVRPRTIEDLLVPVRAAA